MRYRQGTRLKSQPQAQMAHTAPAIHFGRRQHYNPISQVRIEPGSYFVTATSYLSKLKDICLEPYSCEMMFILEFPVCQNYSSQRLKYRPPGPTATVPVGKAPEQYCDASQARLSAPNLVRICTADPHPSSSSPCERRPDCNHARLSSWIFETSHSNARLLAFAALMMAVSEVIRIVVQCRSLENLEF